MHYTHDLDTVGSLWIQDEVPPNWKIAKIRRNVGPCRTKIGLVGEKQEFLLHIVQNAVGSAHIVMSDVYPLDVIISLLRSPLAPPIDHPRTGGHWRVV